MNATELFHADGKPSGVFYCSKCRRTAPSEHLATRCCEPTICACGIVCEDLWHVTCRQCQVKKEVEREAQRFEKAEKVTQWDGFVYCEGCGNEGYCENVSVMIEDLENNDLEVPAYVWTCLPRRFAVIDVADIVERICEDGYDDFDSGDLSGLEELKAAIEVFNNANTRLVCYEPDYTKALLVTKEEVKE